MVDIALIKQLRAQSHAPLKDVKAALEETNGDIDSAKERLRKKGLSKAAKKADRETNEGRIVCVESGDTTAVVGVACETDFVAKNDAFIELVNRVANIVVSHSENFTSHHELDASWLDANVTPVLHEGVASIGENLQLVVAYHTESPVVVYIHTSNKLASVVEYEGDADVAKNVAMQVAAMNPIYLTVDNVPEDAKQAYVQELRKADDLSNKPDDIQQKIISGRMQKFYDEIVLLEQFSIMDDAKRIKELLNGTTIKAYHRFTI